MKILMYGLACDNIQFNRFIRKHNTPYSVAHFSFETALLKELGEYTDVELNHNYILQEEFVGVRNLYIKGLKKSINDKVITTYLNYINLPGIKFISIFFSTFIRTLKWGISNRKDSNRCIISTINYFPVSLANVLASKLLKVCNIIILTDCSNGYAYQYIGSGLKSIIKKNYAKVVNLLECNYDAYIFFSEGMNDQINKKNRPWIVMEGMYPNTNEAPTNCDKKNSIMYAGTLQSHLGIEIFIEAFKLIPEEDIQLWIFGDGDYKDYVLKQVEIDQRIKYYGFVKHDEILKKEKEARLLINTRNPSDAYTWMSFPSKTFEYMASATPFLTTKIKGIPSEYYPYLYTVSYDIEDISKKMLEIMKKNQKELDSFGEEAANFIRRNKNQFKQTEKVFKFINKVTKE